MWGVSRTFGAAQSGSSEGNGSGSVTSSAARRRPSCRRSSNAFWSTTPPRPALTSKAPGFILPIRLASISPAVDGVRGSRRMTMSALGIRRSKSDTGCTPDRLLRATRLTVTPNGLRRLPSARCAPATSRRWSCYPHRPDTESVPRSVTDCGLGDRSLDPGDNRRTPRTLQRHRPRKRLGRLPDRCHGCADTPRQPASARSQCPLADALLEQRADTCSLATHPSQQSAHRQSHRRAPPPEGQPGNLQSGAQRHLGGRP